MNTDFSTFMRTPTSFICTTFLLFSLSGCGGGSGVATPTYSVATPTYTIGGNVSGLDGGVLTLLDNDSDALRLTTNGAFTLATPLTFNAPYAVTVGTQPFWQFCDVSGGSGTATANVTSIVIACSPALADVTTLAGTTTLGHNDGTGAAASFHSPTGVTVDAGGNLYVTDAWNHEIRKITPDGVVTTLAGSTTPGDSDGTGTAASFNLPIGVTIDASGNLYVVDGGNNEIRKITPNGVVTTLAGSKTPGYKDGTGANASFKSPYGVTVDASGNLYVADQGNNAIRKITPAGVVTTLAGTTAPGHSDGTGTAASFNQPIGVTVDASGNLYVVDYGNNAIRKITSAGVVTTLAGSTTPGHADGTDTAASFNNPYGVTVDASGNLYIADQGNNEIRKITSAGVVTTLAGSTTPGHADGTGAAASFNLPTGVTVDASGNLYIADQGNNAIRKITPTH
ncbi:NHL repeat-containing protein [Paraburkholderia fungorum]|uniref:NHL repeat-containing protein n=1 Tax=Paraburkholderia fungorum TaxID=134537 RepID=UPI00402B9414